MSFVQIAFAYFLPIVFSGWTILRHHYTFVLIWLLVASLAFYGFNQWQLLIIILGYCIIDWGTGLWLRVTKRRRLVLGAGIAFNLMVLSYYKYTPLLLDTAAALLGWQPVRTETVVSGSWVIPMGISFYALTGVAYMADVYRGLVTAETNFWRYALYMTFFPHLAAGPILRPSEFLEHLRPRLLPDRPQALSEATFLLARGFFKKLVLADNIALAIDPFFSHITDATTAGVWALPYVYLYALQIYFDFSGYTDIARGLGLLFGFRWPENFNSPYLATSIQEFWRRWHMTLSRFLRDYLYIPLGGRRCGAFRSGGNLMLTMLIGGLWHGASWSFMLWGGLHGGFLVVHRLWQGTKLQIRLASLTGPSDIAWRWCRIALTFHAVCFGWCFFRLTHLADSLACVYKWVNFDLDKAFVGATADVGLWLLFGAYGLAALGAHYLTHGASLPDVAAHMNKHPLTRGVLLGGSAGMFALALLLRPNTNAEPFIYFRF